MKPSLHAQVNETPLPGNPVLHAHVNELTVFEHVDTPAVQLCVPEVHSSKIPSDAIVFTNMTSPVRPF
jgi:hypothetical protein